MKITILTLGSRGDLQPYLALAVGLQRAGHLVTLAAPASAAAWVQAYGVGLHPVRFDLQAFLQQPEIQAVLNGRNLIKQLRVIQRDLPSGMRQALADFWDASADADYVVASSPGYNGLEAAARRGAPLAYALLAPTQPATRAFPSFALPVRRSLGGAYNHLTFALVLRLFWPTVAGTLNRWRAEQLGLGPWRSLAHLLAPQPGPARAWLYAYSPHLLPKPGDWPVAHAVTGYWFLPPPPAWEPPADLLHFLAAGPPPVYVGFGSMRPPQAARLTRHIVRALELSGQRGVLLAGAGTVTPPAAPPNLFAVDDVPHCWLFPRMAAVVHHGGAGTTGAGLAAGVPSLITPFIGDQFAWAEQVAQVGAGPRVGPAGKLTAETLAAAITVAVNDKALRARAAALGEQIRAEDGVGKAVGLIEAHAARHRAGV